MVSNFDFINLSASRVYSLIRHQNQPEVFENTITTKILAVVNARQRLKNKRILNLRMTWNVARLPDGHTQSTVFPGF